MYFAIADSRAASILAPVLAGMPPFTGAPIAVSFLPELTTRCGGLLSAAGVGTPVHAGSHVRRRQMVLDSCLLLNRAELIRIFVHEVYHFVWARLGNPRRNIYSQLLDNELEAHVRGELGWSAADLKRRLTQADRRARSRQWRDYTCESFCDTAARIYTPRRRHAEWTLAAYRLQARRACLAQMFDGRLVAL